MEILAESVVWESSLPLSAIPLLVRGRREWSGGLAGGWMLVVVGTTGIDEGEALETRQMGGRGHTYTG